MVAEFMTRRPAVVLIWTLIALFMLEPCSLALAEAQSDCAKNIKAAQKKFDEGDFDGSISLLDCLTSADLSVKDKTAGYEILAQDYLSKNSTDQANSAVRKLLEVSPNYKPSEAQTSPAYVDLVEKIRAEMPKETPKKKAESEPQPPPATQAKEEPGFFAKNWMWIAGGAVAAGVIVAVVASKKSDNGTTPATLPDPPGRP